MGIAVEEMLAVARAAWQRLDGSTPAFSVAHDPGFTAVEPVASLIAH